MTAPAIINCELLDLLLRQNQPTSVHSLSQQLAISPADVLRQLQQLTDAGCTLGQNPQLGVQLQETGLSCWQDYLAWRSKPKQRAIEIYQRTASTQDVLRRMADSPQTAQPPDRTLAVAAEQTAGRGRLGRQWVSPAGSGITFSLLRVYPKAAAPSPDHLILATAVACAQALEQLAPAGAPSVQIKWPNDLMVRDKKLGGILVEQFSPQQQPQNVCAIIGIGINVALTPEQIPPELSDTVTSLHMQNWTCDRLLVLGELIDHIDALLDDADPAHLVQQWRQRNQLGERWVRLRSNGEPLNVQVLDVDPHEGLVARTEFGTIVRLAAATTSVNASPSGD